MLASQSSRIRKWWGEPKHVAEPGDGADAKKAARLIATAFGGFQLSCNCVDMPSPHAIASCRPVFLCAISFTVGGEDMRFRTCLASREERAMPADSLVPDRIGTVTHGVTIDAPPEGVWPWLAQLGGGRGMHDAAPVSHRSAPTAD